MLTEYNAMKITNIIPGKIDDAIKNSAGERNATKVRRLKAGIRLWNFKFYCFIKSNDHWYQIVKNSGKSQSK